MHTNEDGNTAAAGETKVIGRRLTIHVHPGTRSFLESASIEGRSHSERIGRLADRYRAIMDDSTILRTWRPVELAAVVVAGRGINLQRPEDAYVLSVRLKSIKPGRDFQGACDVAALSYRVSSLSLTDVLRLIDLCERYDEAEPTPEGIEAWLISQGMRK